MKRIFLSLNYKVVLDVLAAVGALVFITQALAQAPLELLVTWSAENYAPTSFNGKIIPIKGSVVNVVLEVIDRNKPLDLSGKKVRWVVDDEAPVSGIGLKHFSFVAGAPAGGEHAVKVSFQSAGGEVSRQVRIPVAGPELAFVKRRVGETSYFFRVLPYFLNVKNLYRETEFSWNVNGKLIAGADVEPDRLVLELGAPQDKEINISVTVKNGGRPLELVKDSFSFVH